MLWLANSSFVQCKQQICVKFRAAEAEISISTSHEETRFGQLAIAANLWCFLWIFLAVARPAGLTLRPNELCVYARFCCQQMNEHFGRRLIDLVCLFFWARAAQTDKQSGL